MKKLADFGFDVYSQSGEDGIIQAIFERIGHKTSLCVEFGAADGMRVSNTANLWQNGWRAILIEADAGLYAQLQQATQDYDCLCLHEFIETSGEQTIEAILKQNAVPAELDLMSIDIDGNDYYIFESLRELRPRVVVCEYNPTIPIHLDIVAEPDNYFGCSARALIRLAESKGYRLVAMTRTNCIFVTADEFHHFDDLETAPEAVAVDFNLVYLITSFDGQYVLSRKPPFGMKGVYTGPLQGDIFRPKPISVPAQSPGRLRKQARRLLRRFRMLVQTL